MTASFRRVIAPLTLATAAVSASAQTTPGAWRGGSVPDAPIRTTALPPSGVAPASEIADRYLERTRTDGENADLWVYCAAAALKRSIAGDAEADAYARDIAATLKPTLDRSATSPCEDAIPARVWGGGDAAIGGTPGNDPLAAPDPAALTPAEEERLRRANAEADAQEGARVAAQAAAKQRRTEAQARYDRERADYEAQVAAARAAEADYQRRLAEHRRLLESGHYQAPQ